MKSKDADLLAEAYSKVLKEQSGFSIGNELYKLYTELEPNAKTKSGARVSDVLKSILEELQDVKDPFYFKGYWYQEYLEMREKYHRQIGENSKQADRIVQLEAALDAMVEGVARKTDSQQAERIRELEEQRKVVQSAKSNADQPEVLHSLLQKLSLD